MPMAARAAQAGLSRFVRAPTADPRWTSGITGTVIQNEGGGFATSLVTTVQGDFDFAVVEE